VGNFILPLLRNLRLPLTKRYEEARQYFNNAIDLDPLYAKAWLDKSSTLAILGRIDEANAAIDKLAELTGDTIAYYPNI
jgi:tetratricopeptide (TPR) repeat protein